MAIGSDRVQVLKQETSSLGGDSADTVDYPAPIAPQEDALESAGIFLQDGSNRDENVYIERNGDDMRFRDVNNPTPVTLSALLTNVATEVGQVFISINGSTMSAQLPLTAGENGWLLNDDGVMLVVG